MKGRKNDIKTKIFPCSSLCFSGLEIDAFFAKLKSSSSSAKNKKKKYSKKEAKEESKNRKRKTSGKENEMDVNNKRRKKTCDPDDSCHRASNSKVLIPTQTSEPSAYPEIITMTTLKERKAEKTRNFVEKKPASCLGQDVSLSIPKKDDQDRGTICKLPEQNRRPSNEICLVDQSQNSDSESNSFYNSDDEGTRGLFGPRLDQECKTRNIGMTSSLSNVCGRRGLRIYQEDQFQSLPESSPDSCINPEPNIEVIPAKTTSNTLIEPQTPIATIRTLSPKPTVAIIKVSSWLTNETVR